MSHHHSHESNSLQQAVTPTRRAFLKNGGIGLLTFAAGPTFLKRAAWSASSSSSRRKVLVAIFQRGAMDGLAAVPPLEESRRLAKLRPRLHVSAARAAGEQSVLDLGVGYGMHPAFAELLPLFEEKRLGIVHAVGSHDPTRSHFDAQDYMETATPGRKGTRSGWLNRVVGELGHEGTPFRAVSLTSALPRSFYGEHSALAVANLDDFRVRASGARQSVSAGNGFESLYQQTTQDLLRSTGEETFEAMDVLSKLGSADSRRGRRSRANSYPRSPLGNSLNQIARLIKADVGLEVAFAESGGWDTHVRQGALGGSFANRGRDLAQSIAAFWDDLGDRQDDVVVMTMTEFGRTAAENGSAGTDHGHASCLFVLGNTIDGGKVHGRFPGLAEGDLYEGRDLAVTTDFRSVFASVARDHLGVSDLGQVFPGWKAKPMELFRA